MYESPISIAEMTDNIIKKQNEQFENDLMFQLRASYHIDVDKDELIKALQYDRDQYERGYQDGKSAGYQQVESEKRKGYWFDVGSLFCRCSECGCKNSKESNYCPECGAYMKG